jgi:hypothetical protein
MFPGMDGIEYVFPITKKARIHPAVESDGDVYYYYYYYITPAEA